MFSTFDRRIPRWYCQNIADVTVIFYRCGIRFPRSRPMSARTTPRRPEKLQIVRSRGSAVNASYDYLFGYNRANENRRVNGELFGGLTGLANA